MITYITNILSVPWKVYLRNIPGLEQVWGLEDLLVRDSVLLDGAQEGLHVLHQEEGGALKE